MTAPGSAQRVLDSSALLAYVFGEPGATELDLMFESALVSAVNWSEILQKAGQRHGEPRRTATLLLAGGVTVAPFDRAQAEGAAALWQQTRAKGLSLADRACLALGLSRGVPVITADRAWAELRLDVDIVVIR